MRIRTELATVAHLYYGRECRSKSMNNSYYRVYQHLVDISDITQTFIVTPCIIDIKHFIIQLTHTT